MAQKYQVKAHAVEARKVASVQPLVAHGKMLSPNDGLTLILDDGTKETWVAEQNAAVPNIGDWFVVDDALRTTFVMPAQKFAELFSVMAA
jgi:hypothetical protein